MSIARKLTAPQPWSLDLSAASGVQADGHCIGLGSSLQPEQLLTYAVDHGLRHICQNNGFEYDKEMDTAKVLVSSPENFKEFPVASILSPATLSKESEAALLCMDERFHSSGEKRGLIEVMTKAMNSKGLSQTLQEDIVSVADEMFTNAVFNAPFVDIVTHLNPGVSRHETEVRYDAGKYARMFMAADKTRLVLGCEDPFGSLNLQRYMGKIRETYMRGPAATMNFGPGGAGIGSYIIFNAGSSLYFGVWPGRSTILCCVVPTGMSYRKRTLLPKHLHWIQR